MSRTSTAAPESVGGRPRDPRVDAAVLAAARELVREAGYGAASIEAISRRAGVSRPAIYRRWRTKAELVFEAVYPGDEVLPIADTGEFATDLACCVRRTVELFTRPEVRAAIPGLLADLHADPEPASTPARCSRRSRARCCSGSSTAHRSRAAPAPPSSAGSSTCSCTPRPHDREGTREVRAVLRDPRRQALDRGQGAPGLPRHARAGRVR
jgi:AcrR family transcriptional regulator